MCISCRQAGAMTDAMPPVATTVARQPSSDSIRSIMPSSSSAEPSTQPLCMQPSVSVPMAFSGTASGISGSSAVPPASADSARFAPGRIAPPRNAPCASSTEMVVAVPMSISSSGGRYRPSAPTAAVSRSAPSVSGWRIITGIRQRTFSPTTSGSFPVSSRAAPCRARVTGGTTEEMMTCSTSRLSTSASSRSWLSATA